MPDELIELQGASGARYRFRRMRDIAGLPAEGGNFLYVRHEADGVVVIASGAAESLQLARGHWSAAVEQHGADSIYVRLNIGSRQRALEREDIAAAHVIPMRVEV